MRTSAIIDGTFGLAFNALGDVAENTIQINNKQRQSYLENLMKSNTKGYNSWVDGGGRRGLVNAIERS